MENEKGTVKLKIVFLRLKNGKCLFVRLENGNSAPYCPPQMTASGLLFGKVALHLCCHDRL